MSVPQSLSATWVSPGATRRATTRSRGPRTAVAGFLTQDTASDPMVDHSPHPRQRLQGRRRLVSAISADHGPFTALLITRNRQPSPRWHAVTDCPPSRPKPPTSRKTDPSTVRQQRILHSSKTPSDPIPVAKGGRRPLRSEAVAKEGTARLLPGAGSIQTSIAPERYQLADGPRRSAMERGCTHGVAQTSCRGQHVGICVDSLSASSN